jgi:hypothetical protein
VLCWAPIGLYLHQPDGPQLNEDASPSLAPSAMHGGFQVSEACRGRTHRLMTVRAAALANLHSNHDSIKIPSEEKGIQLKNNTASLSRRYVELFQNYAVKKFGRYLRQWEKHKSAARRIHTRLLMGG